MVSPTAQTVAVSADTRTQIHQFHIDHNAPCLPPPLPPHKFISFLLGIPVVPREIQDNDYAKFWGVNKVHVKIVYCLLFCLPQIVQIK